MAPHALHFPLFFCLHYIRPQPPHARALLRCIGNVCLLRLCVSHLFLFLSLFPFSAADDTFLLAQSHPSHFSFTQRLGFVFRSAAILLCAFLLRVSFFFPQCRSNYSFSPAPLPPPRAPISAFEMSRSPRIESSLRILLDFYNVSLCS